MSKVKRGQLSKVETFYIDENFRSMSVEELATDLNRNIKSIETYIKKTYKTKKSGTTAGEHFIRQNGVTIMSENASTIADATRKVPAKPKSCVTRITYDE